MVSEWIHAPYLFMEIKMSCTIKVCGNDFNFKNGLANSPDEIRCCRLFSFHFIFVWWIIVSVEMGNECDAIIKLYVSLALIMPFKLLQNPNRSTEMVASCCTIGRKNSNEMNWVDAFGCMYYFKWKPPKHCSFIWYANYLCTRTHSQSVNWRVRYRHYPKSFIKWDKCHQHSLTHTHSDSIAWCSWISLVCLHWILYGKCVENSDIFDSTRLRPHSHRTTFLTLIWISSFWWLKRLHTFPPFLPGWKKFSIPFMMSNHSHEIKARKKTGETFWGVARKVIEFSEAMI